LKHKLFYAYLILVDRKNSTGADKYHLLYDAYKNEQDVLVPATSSFFWRDFERTWLKESALWIHALVVLLKKMPKKHVYDNDQHMQDVIKKFKSQPNRKMDCDESALYFFT
jgi:hypothetical protein